MQGNAASGFLFYNGGDSSSVCEATETAKVYAKDIRR